MKNRMNRTFASFGLVLVIAAPAYATRAEVTHRIRGCDWFLAESSGGFVLLEWYGGNDPDKGDTLVGELHSYGMKSIFNTTADSELRVYIEDYMLDKEDALEKLYEQCE